MTPPRPGGTAACRNLSQRYFDPGSSIQQPDRPLTQTGQECASASPPCRLLFQGGLYWLCLPACLLVLLAAFRLGSAGADRNGPNALQHNSKSRWQSVPSRVVGSPDPPPALPGGASLPQALVDQPGGGSEGAWKPQVVVHRPGTPGKRSRACAGPPETG